jgi:Zn-dependent membrane protease YugP
MPENTPTWDRWFKVASVATTSVVFPGIAWAIQHTQDLAAVRLQVQVLAQQMESDRRGMGILLEEMKQLRGSVDLLRSDILQRLTRVETRIEGK